MQARADVLDSSAQQEGANWRGRSTWGHAFLCALCSLRNPAILRALLKRHGLRLLSALDRLRAPRSRHEATTIQTGYQEGQGLEKQRWPLGGCHGESSREARTEWVVAVS